MQLANLPLQILLYFNHYFLVGFFWIMGAIYVYKGVQLLTRNHRQVANTLLYSDYALTYPSHAFGLDVSVFVFFVLLEFGRIFLGECFSPVCSFVTTMNFMAASQGNKKEELPILVWSLILAVLSIIGVSYLLQLQTYV